MSGDQDDHDADLLDRVERMHAVYEVQCDICGMEAHPSKMREGWGCWECVGNPECRAPLGPVHRVVTPMTAEELWVLEPDNGDDYYTVPAPWLRWLIDCARKVMRDE